MKIKNQKEKACAMSKYIEEEEQEASHILKERREKQEKWIW